MKLSEDTRIIWYGQENRTRKTSVNNKIKI